MVTQGLREAWTAQRNTAGKTFLALAVLLRASASLGKPVIFSPLKIPLDVYVSPVFFTPRTTSKRSTVRRDALRHIIRVRAIWSDVCGEPVLHAKNRSGDASEFVLFWN
jgi:hypothetical protein